MTRLSAIQADITEVAADAIVNAANSSLAGGGGVDGAIHRRGGPTIAEQCRRWIEANGPLPTGEAMVSDGGDLPARWVIHTVGPVYDDHDPATAAGLLADCYRNCLELGVARHCATVAFPGISTGVYGYPKKEAAEVAVSTVHEWLGRHDELDEVIFVCFSEGDLPIYQTLIRETSDGGR